MLGLQVKNGDSHLDKFLPGITGDNGSNPQSHHFGRYAAQGLAHRISQLAVLGHSPWPVLRRPRMAGFEVTTEAAPCFPRPHIFQALFSPSIHADLRSRKDFSEIVCAAGLTALSLAR